ncbi:hypothetical protein MKX03_028380 [Papaver bracteatum]|nr:hypothetical protein MKX03_028380 [Papaver bracteatum]
MDEDCILPLAEKQARKIKFSLDRRIPSLIIIMKPSHVVRGFWLGIPKDFGTAFMSKVTISMTLLDQEGKSYEVTYIAARTGLSGGWKGFAEDHNLKVGDAVLFQLVNLREFKVFIVRKNGVADFDGAPDTDGTSDIQGDLSLLQLNAQESAQGDAGKKLKRERKTVAKRQRVGDALKPEEKPAEKRRRRAPSSVIRDENGSQQQPDDNGDVEDSVVGDFESFAKIVNDLVGDSEMPEDVMAKYYELCCTHNSFLHTNIPPGHNSNLVAGMIIATVEIVHGIMSCKVRDTFNGEVSVWRNKLEAFEKLGMSVDFVFPRLNQLQKLSETALRRLPYQQMYPELCNP